MASAQSYKRQYLIQSKIKFFYMQTRPFRYSLTALSVLLLCFSTAFAQTYSDIDDELNKRLLREDITALAEQSLRESTANVRSLARQAVIFNRAGHEDRAKQTARKLLEIAKTNEDFSLVAAILGETLPNDFTAWKRFYERAISHYNSLNNDHQLKKILSEWEKTGNLDEIESWLVERHASNKEWFDVLFAWRLKHNRANEMKAAFCREMQTELNANPNDLKIAEEFLQRSGMCGNANVLVENFASTDAFDYYWIGRVLHSYGSRVGENDERTFFSESAAKFLRRSLELPYKPSDGDKIWSVAWRYVSIPPQIPNFNPEKQLRYWTKRKLAEVYKDSQQPLLAQPIVEELTAMDKSGIQEDDPNRLAGAVQAASGMRVVESRILQEEATRRDTSQYWLERVSYYKGRKEPELVRQTFVEALKTFPYNFRELNSEKDFELDSFHQKSINRRRLAIIDSYLRFLTDDLNCDDLKGIERIVKS